MPCQKKSQGTLVDPLHSTSGPLPVHLRSTWPSYMHLESRWSYEMSHNSISHKNWISPNSRMDGHMYVHTEKSDFKRSKKDLVTLTWNDDRLNGKASRYKSDISMELLDFRSSRSNPNRMMMEIVLEQWAQTKIDILFTFGKIMNYYVLYRKITKTNSSNNYYFLDLFDKRCSYTVTQLKPDILHWLIHMRWLTWSQTIVEQKIRFLGTFLGPYIQDFSLKRLYKRVEAKRSCII